MLCISGHHMCHPSLAGLEAMLAVQASLQISLQTRGCSSTTRPLLPRLSG